MKVTADHGTFTLTFTDGSGHAQTTTPLASDIGPAALATALNKLPGVDVAVTQLLATDPFSFVFNHNGARTPFSADPTQLARGPPLLAYADGIITFTFDLGTSVQLEPPVQSRSSTLLGDQLGPFADIANALIGLGGSGTLTLNASAQLHVSLGLDLSSALMVGTTTEGGSGSEVETVKINATGGTFKLSYQAPTSPPQNLAASATTGGTLTASTTYYYKVTAVTSNGETIASSETSAATDTSNKTISLHWDPVAQATSYKIYRGTGAGAESGFFTSMGASFADNGSASPTGSSTPPSTSTVTTTETTTPIAYNAPATGANRVKAALEALAGLSGKIDDVTFDSTSSTYTITFSSSLGNVTQLVGDGAALTGTTHSFYVNTGPGNDATHLDLTASAAGQNLNFHAMLGPFGLFVRDGSASLGGTIRLHLTDGATRHDGKLNLV